MHEITLEICEREVHFRLPVKPMELIALLTKNILQNKRG